MTYHHTSVPWRQDFPQIPMNWRYLPLINTSLFQIPTPIPCKAGQANLLDIELTYEGLRNAIQEGVGLAGTIEFFRKKENIILTGTEMPSLFKPRRPRNRANARLRKKTRDQSVSQSGAVNA